MKRYCKYNQFGDVEEYFNGVLIDGDTSILNPTPEQLAEHGWVEYKPKIYEMTLEEAKANKIEEITVYDDSNAVNAFYVNGVEMWFEKELRTPFLNVANIKLEMGEPLMTISNSKVGMSVDLPPQTAIQIMKEVEIYAYACLLVTEKHKITVRHLETIDEVLNFDITQGYPEKLVYNIE